MQQAIWEARGRCGGKFVPGRYVTGGTDEEGFFVRASNLATDAEAPCFDRDEKFRTCPVAMAGSKVVRVAFDLHSKAEKGMLPVVAPLDRLTGLAVQMIDEVDTALYERNKYRDDQRQKKQKADAAKAAARARRVR